MVKYAVDFSHSAITFSVKHMMISNVKGSFDSFTAIVEADTIEDLTTAKISVVIDVASISTKDQARDHHLSSADFFHADKYPKIYFTSKEIIAINEHTYHIIGDLTIKEVTNSIIFTTSFIGHTKSPWGQEKYGFTAETKVNRRDFKLLYNAVLESGGLLIGEDVDVFIDFQLYLV
ncbi:polyisoprenoid-binding protein YceI [Ureibacillus xyleni]|uniref:Polyisoprenoid-binding protein YceI n=1 Tax=Ureibacillus xyleni TaxID=614648 RepID=A0A285TBM4_9BACL|nr:YceI family protein [Ureibacillus xyleni]SOC18443.1 polyisoprenoid-binding protein YceI [Ureibacillus xyleni]